MHFFIFCIFCTAVTWARFSDYSHDSPYEQWKRPSNKNDLSPIYWNNFQQPWSSKGQLYQHQHDNPTWPQNNRLPHHNGHIHIPSSRYVLYPRQGNRHMDGFNANNVPKIIPRMGLPSYRTPNEVDAIAPRIYVPGRKAIIPEPESDESEISDSIEDEDSVSMGNRTPPPKSRPASRNLVKQYRGDPERPRRPSQYSRSPYGNGMGANNGNTGARRPSQFNRPNRVGQDRGYPDSWEEENIRPSQFSKPKPRNSRGRDRAAPNESRGAKRRPPTNSKGRDKGNPPRTNYPQFNEPARGGTYPDEDIDDGERRPPQSNRPKAPNDSLKRSSQYPKNTKQPSKDSKHPPYNTMGSEQEHSESTEDMKSKPYQISSLPNKNIGPYGVNPDGKTRMPPFKPTNPRGRNRGNPGKKEDKNRRPSQFSRQPPYNFMRPEREDPENMEFSSRPNKNIGPDNPEVQTRMSPFKPTNPRGRSRGNPEKKEDNNRRPSQFSRQPPYNLMRPDREDPESMEFSSRPNKNIGPDNPEVQTRMPPFKPTNPRGRSRGNPDKKEDKNRRPSQFSRQPPYNFMRPERKDPENMEFSSRPNKNIGPDDPEVQTRMSPFKPTNPRGRSRGNPEKKEDNNRRPSQFSRQPPYNLMRPDREDPESMEFSSRPNKNIGPDHPEVQTRMPPFKPTNPRGRSRGNPNKKEDKNRRPSQFSRQPPYNLMRPDREDPESMEFSSRPNKNIGPDGENPEGQTRMPPFKPTNPRGRSRGNPDKKEYKNRRPSQFSRQPSYNLMRPDREDPESMEFSSRPNMNIGPDGDNPDGQTRMPPFKPTNSRGRSRGNPDKKEDTNRSSSQFSRQPPYNLMRPDREDPESMKFSSRPNKNIGPEGDNPEGQTRMTPFKPTNPRGRSRGSPDKKEDKNKRPSQFSRRPPYNLMRPDSEEPESMEDTKARPPQFGNRPSTNNIEPDGNDSETMRNMNRKPSPFDPNKPTNPQGKGKGNSDKNNRPTQFNKRPSSNTMRPERRNPESMKDPNRGSPQYGSRPKANNREPDSMSNRKPSPSTTRKSTKPQDVSKNGRPSPFSERTPSSSASAKRGNPSSIKDPIRKPSQSGSSPNTNNREPDKNVPDTKAAVSRRPPQFGANNPTNPGDRDAGNPKRTNDMSRRPSQLGANNPTNPRQRDAANPKRTNDMSRRPSQFPRGLPSNTMESDSEDEEDDDEDDYEDVNQSSPEFDKRNGEGPVPNQLGRKSMNPLGPNRGNSARRPINVNRREPISRKGPYKNTKPSQFNNNNPRKPGNGFRSPPQFNERSPTISGNRKPSQLNGRKPINNIGNNRKPAPFNGRKSISPPESNEGDINKTPSRNLYKPTGKGRREPERIIGGANKNPYQRKSTDPSGRGKNNPGKTGDKNRRPSQPRGRKAPNTKPKYKGYPETKGRNGNKRPPQSRNNKGRDKGNPDNIEEDDEDSDVSISAQKPPSADSELPDDMDSDSSPSAENRIIPFDKNRPNLYDPYVDNVEGHSINNKPYFGNKIMRLNGCNQ